MAVNERIEWIIKRLNWHHARHEYLGADVMSLAGLTVASEDISFTLNEYTSAQTLTADNFLVIVDASSGSITITLPAAASHTNRIYTIKKIDSSGHKVTIDANGTEKIDGEQTVVLNLQYAYVTIVCDGDEWFIIGGEYVKIEDLLRELVSDMGAHLAQLKKIETQLSSLTGNKLKEGDVNED